MKKKMERNNYVNFIPLTAAEEIARKINYRHEKQLEAKLRCIEQEERHAASVLNKKYAMLTREADRLYLARQSCLSYISIGENGELCIQLNRKRQVPTKTDKYLRPTMMSSSGTNRIFHKDRRHLFNTSSGDKDIKRINNLHVAPVTRVKYSSESCNEETVTEVRSYNTNRRRTSSLNIDGKHNNKTLLERQNSIPNISNDNLSKTSYRVDHAIPDVLSIKKSSTESGQDNCRKLNHQSNESKHGNIFNSRVPLLSKPPSSQSSTISKSTTTNIQREPYETGRENSGQNKRNTNTFEEHLRIRSFSATERKICADKRNGRPSSTKGSNEA